MMKICFITTGDIKNIATAKRALGLANPLCDRGWNVSIIMEDTPTNRSRIALECDEHVNAYFFTSTSANKERCVKSQLLSKIRPDYVYLCAFVFRNIIKLPKDCKALVEHSELSSAIKDQQPLKRLMNFLLEYYSIIYSDGLLNASKYLQHLYEKRAKKIFLSRTPMLYFPYAYSSKVCNVINKKAASNEDERLFVFLGSLTVNYGAFTMLKAFEEIHKNRPCYHLLLLGKGGDYKSVVEYIKDHNMSSYVHAPGYVAEEDIPIYFSKADAFISPMCDTVQDWARCPSKLYMYLPYKKPIITCKIGEPFYTLGDKGIYFNPFDSVSLANTILGMSPNENWALQINPLLHEWTQRAVDFDKWINKCFK